jgi:hypothetical protein
VKFLKVNLIKSEIPIIWLDTFAIINFTKLLTGENISQIDKDRYSILYEILNNKIHNKKLICVKSEQIEEIKLGKRLINESDNILTRLSLGVRAKGSYAIERSQLYKFMLAYYKSFDEIDINYKDAFYKDPIKELKSNKQYIISVKEQINEEIINSNKKRKKELNLELEELRQKCTSERISYNKQLEKEKIAIIEAIVY